MGRKYLPTSFEMSSSCRCRTRRCASSRVFPNRSFSRYIPFARSLRKAHPTPSQPVQTPPIWESRGKDSRRPGTHTQYTSCGRTSVARKTSMAHRHRRLRLAEGVADLEAPGSVAFRRCQSSQRAMSEFRYWSATDCSTLKRRRWCCRSTSPRHQRRETRLSEEHYSRGLGATRIRAPLIGSALLQIQTPPSTGWPIPFPGCKAFSAPRFRFARR